MSNEMMIGKIKRISKAIAVILKVCQIFCYIGLGVLASAIVYIGVVGGLDSVIMSSRVTIMPPLSKEMLAELGQGNTIVMCIVGMIKVGLYLAIFIFARKIFVEVTRSDTPFAYIHVKRMRIIALLMFIANTFSESAQGSSLNVRWELNLVGIIAAFIIWGFSYIYEYGCRLQQESDETL